MATVTSRRRFLTATTAAGPLVLLGTRASRSIAGANDRIRIAVLGCNGRGRAHLNGFGKVPGVEIAAVVDPDQRVVDRTLANLQKKAGEKPLATRGERDFRRVLDDPSIDAITIATPNHWHSLMTIMAAQAGKHVYVEKPLSHDIAEGRSAVAAAKKYGIVVQHGTQRRSNAGIAGLHEALKNGSLPRLKIAYGYCCKPRNGIGTKPDSDPPAELDWDLWKGPAVIDRYNPNYVHYNWHWFWKTGNGDLNNQGTHQLDVARWAIDDDQTHPVRAMAIGGRFAWHDQGETPNTMFAMAEYPNGQMVLFNVRNVNYEGYRHQVCNEYYLEDGSVITGEGTYKIRRPGSETAEDLPLPPGTVTPGGEWASFIAAVRAGDPALANGGILDAHYGCVLGHLMNNSYRLGTEVPFDAKAASFGDDREVAAHFEKLHAIMQDGVGVPADATSYRLGPWLSFDAETERFTGERAAEANQLLEDPHTAAFQVPKPDDV
jgi:predicted dehydrogenase